MRFVAGNRRISVVRTKGRMIAAGSSPNIALFLARLLFIVVIRRF
jgi:hypothetical protein